MDRCDGSRRWLHEGRDADTSPAQAQAVLHQTGQDVVYVLTNKWHTVDQARVGWKGDRWGFLGSVDV